MFGNVTDNPTIQLTTKLLVQQALKKQITMFYEKKVSSYFI